MYAKWVVGKLGVGKLDCRQTGCIVYTKWVVGKIPKSMSINDLQPIFRLNNLYIYIPFRH